ncbi:Os03g0755200 [Oryza sativa Japonica Group]|nr:hypothetical protein OsJ_12613 [Oryza sativa Japonica Group]BAS86445.1 Os03g0755200 [Oryza sativa Japonica Group]
MVVIRFGCGSARNSARTPGGGEDSKTAVRSIPILLEDDDGGGTDSVVAQANPPPVVVWQSREHIQWWRRGRGELIAAVDGGSGCGSARSSARMPSGGEDSKTR